MYLTALPRVVDGTCLDTGDFTCFRVSCSNLFATRMAMRYLNMVMIPRFEDHGTPRVPCFYVSRTRPVK